jgi:hypothetical protein
MERDAREVTLCCDSPISISASVRCLNKIIFPPFLSEPLILTDSTFLFLKIHHKRQKMSYYIFLRWCDQKIAAYNVKAIEYTVPPWWVIVIDTERTDSV